MRDLYSVISHAKFSAGNKTRGELGMKLRVRQYIYRQNVGKSRHVVSFHDGTKLNDDGSPFYDVRIFSRKGDAAKFMADLDAQERES